MMNKEATGNGEKLGRRGGRDRISVLLHLVAVVVDRMAVTSKLTSTFGSLQQYD
jgi:hypothetical protein